MKTIAQAIKKISLEKSIIPSQILYKKNKDNTYTLLDTVNKDIYSLHAGMLSRSEFNQGLLEETVNQGIFGDLHDLVKRIYQSKFVRPVDLFKKRNEKMDVQDFAGDVKEFLNMEYPNMQNEVDIFVNQNGKELYRIFRSELISNKKKFESDIGKSKGNGKGKSQDSKGIFINMPSRPAMAAKKVEVEHIEKDINVDDSFIGQDKMDELRDSKQPHKKKKEDLKKSDE